MLLLASAVAVVLTVSFLCSIFESVLLSLTPAQIESVARRRRRTGRWLADFKRHIDVPIAAILILNTAAHTIGAAVAGASYTAAFGAGTLWIFTIVFTLAVLLFTEIIPKTLGVSYATALAAPVALGIRFLTFALRPLVVVSSALSRTLRREGASPVTSAEEIRLLAALGRSEGAIGVRTADMIVGATHLRQLTAGDVMRPRRDVVHLTTDMDRDEAMAVIRESGFSRFPLTDGADLEGLRGTVIARDLLFWLHDHPDDDIDWQALTREPVVVPENASLHAMLRNFQTTRFHLSVVVDEYGSVEGIATLEDVLEEIVGEIMDESDQPIEDVWQQADGSLHVRASVELRKIANMLDVPWSAEDDVVTVGGLVTETLGRLPVAGDAIEWHGHRLEVLKAGKRRVERIAIRPPGTQEPDQPV